MRSAPTRQAARPPLAVVPPPAPTLPPEAIAGAARLLLALAVARRKGKG